MPRLIVTTDNGSPEDILWQETVHAPILEHPHAAAQLIERIGLALIDAEEAEEGNLGPH